MILNTQSLSSRFEGWRDLTVDLVTFPAPPVSAKGVFYAADAWGSTTLDRGRDVFNSQKIACLDATMTYRGPAFLLRRRIQDLLNVNRDGHFDAPIYCAMISWERLLEDRVQSYANKALLEGITPISRSCHPGSHHSIPYAPWLTLITQFRRATDSRFEHDPIDEFTFADHIESLRYFPDHDFSRNREVDKLFSTVSLTDLVGTATHHLVVYPVLGDTLKFYVREMIHRQRSIFREATHGEEIDRR